MMYSDRGLFSGSVMLQSPDRSIRQRVKNGARHDPDSGNGSNGVNDSESFFVALNRTTGLTNSSESGALSSLLFCSLFARNDGNGFICDCGADEIRNRSDHSQSGCNSTIVVKQPQHGVFSNVFIGIRCKNTVDI